MTIRMDTIRVKRFQERLLKRRKEILRALNRLEEENRKITGQRHFDWLDQAWDENEARLLDQLSAGYLRELGRIDIALGRILSGTYGLCLACHQLIEKARLDTFPETESCLGCQEMRERFEKAA